MSQPDPQLNLAGDMPSGWRLDRLELANWGTFTGESVHVLAPECGWTLLVGENGSGKTPTIDALRTLLVQPTSLRYSFNDAAGGQRRQDRTLASYIRGVWSASKDEDSGDTTPRFLRNEEIPTFLLAVFRNLRTQSALTLAQILWVSSGKHDQYYLIAEGNRTIRKDLSGIERGRGLKKELSNRGFQIWDGYRPYREEFCAKMGIPGEGALEIFNQAIGVKEVSDVGHFLRRHMLSQGTVTEFIHSRVIPQFHDLESCWKDIEQAREQIDILNPVAKAFSEIQEFNFRRSGMQKISVNLPLYYKIRERDLLGAHIANRSAQLVAANAQKTEKDEHLAALQRQRDSLNSTLDGMEVAVAIHRIDAEIADAQRRANEQEVHHAQLKALLQHQNLGAPPTSEESFLEMKKAVSVRVGELVQQEQDANNEANKAGREKSRIESELSDIREELDLLANRRVLIPANFLDIREQLCQETGIPEERLPFAGELVEVQREYLEEWGGSLERLFHTFAISLLVPESLYSKVAPWINRRRLTDRRGSGIRLHFHRVPSAQATSSGTFDSRYAVGRLNFLEEHPLVGWVREEMLRSFPHICCRDTGELEGVTHGLTKEGLIRGGSRHVKDDRSPINSRRDHVMGWSPERKIEDLIRHEKESSQLLEAQRALEEEGRAHAKTLGQQHTALMGIQSLPGFSEINFEQTKAKLHQLVIQKGELENSSLEHKSLRKQLRTLEEQSKSESEARDVLLKQIGNFEKELGQSQARFAQISDTPAYLEESDLAECMEFAKEAEEEPPTHESIQAVQLRVQRRIDGSINNLQGKISAAEGSMNAPMQKFLERYPKELANLKAAPSYAEDFVAHHRRLIEEDLPKHQERFRDFLNTNLTENIGGLEDKLNTEVREHKARIDQVNRALAGLEFSEGTYVEIDRHDTRNPEIADFKRRLRQCLAAGLNPDQDERLTLFQKIREIVVSLGDKPEWAARVTDTRLWLEFAVSERRRSDGIQTDYLGSSTGKSGGQKARLAFTILAASLMAQYGMADGVERSDSFRVVVVDEVFARTDEANSRRALEIFRKTGFQLLLAAPWKAEARIAEQYVDSFHLTLNPDGGASKLVRASRTECDAQRGVSDAAQG